MKFSWIESRAEILALVFLQLALYLPLHFHPWLAFYNEFFAWLAIAFLLFALIFSKVILVSKNHYKHFVFLAVIVLFIFLQYLAGKIIFFADFFLSAAYVLGAGFCYFYASSSLNRERFANQLAWTFLIFSLISIFVGFSQILFVQWGIWVADNISGRTYGNITQPNILATLLGFSLVSVVFLYERLQIGKILALVLSVLILILLVSTRSKSLWISLLLFVVWYFYKFKLIGLKLSPLAVMSSAMFFVLLSIAWSDIYLYINADISSAIDLARSAAPRFVVWQQLVRELPTNFFGFGWNQVSLAQVQSTYQYSTPAHFDYSHNILIDLLVWNGLLVGGMIIASCTAFLFYALVRCNNLISWYSLGAFCFFITHSMFEYPHAYAFVLFPASLFLGLCVKLPKQVEVKVTRAFVSVVSLCVFSMLCIIWLDYRKIESDYRLLRFEAAKIGTLKADHLYPETILIDNAPQFIGFARRKVNIEMSEEELAIMELFAHRYPYLPSLTKYWLALAVNGYAEKAEKEYQLIDNMYGKEYSQDIIEFVEKHKKLYPELEKLNLP